jgi:hypothetical protein
MGIKYGGTHYYGTRGSIAQTYFNATSKSDAKVNVSMLPKEVQASAKRFFNRASNSYDSFSASEDTSGNVILIKENPGNAPGSRAIYFLVIDSKGNKIDSYKETYDPEGNLVHRKEK